jgi:hypothetical protein
MANLPVIQSERPGGNASRSALSVLHEPTGVAAAVATSVICIVLSLALWAPLSWPSSAIGDALPAASCSRSGSGLRPALCALQVAITPMLAPLLLAFVAFAFRGGFTAAVRAAPHRAPSGLGPVLASIVATVAFTLIWSGSHIGRSTESGVVPQIAFPAVVGVCTFLFARWGGALRPFFGVRDRVSLGIRVVLVIALPIALAVWLANGSGADRIALNEQLTVVFGIVVAFLLVAPNSTSKGPRA